MVQLVEVLTAGVLQEVTTDFVEVETMEVMVDVMVEVVVTIAQTGVGVGVTVEQVDVIALPVTDATAVMVVQDDVIG